MIKKKAQAALEFLMTYGWAILVVLIAIGALAYFGVLNPSRFLPSSCVYFPGVGCSNFKISTTGVEMVIQNGMGITLTNLLVTVENSGTDCDGTAGAMFNFTDGATNKTTITCTPGASKDRFKGDLVIEWTEGTGANAISHAKSGQIVGQVE